MSNRSLIEFITPTVEFVPSYLDFFGEMRAHGDPIWEKNLPTANESHPQFIERLTDDHRNPPEGLVAESAYWAIQDSHVVGRISLRHELNANLREFGGNIGYEVKPSARRKGIATEMLRRILEMEKAKSIGKLLLTCAPTNIASIKTIERNGGVLEKVAFVEKIQRETCYYWINLVKK